MTIESFLRDVLETSEHNSEHAKALARARLLNEHTLRDEIARPLWERAIDAGIDGILRAQRNANHWHTAKGAESRPSPGLLRGMRDVGTQMLMDYQIGDRHLGDIAKSEIRVLAVQGKKAIQQHTAHVAFLFEVVGLLKRENDTPRKTLTERDLVRCRDRAKKADVPESEMANAS